MSRKYFVTTNRRTLWFDTPEQAAEFVRTGLAEQEWVLCASPEVQRR